MTLTCLIRKERVAATPEEIVRQRILTAMVGTLGYPQSCLAVEKSLRQLPYVKNAPARRADILCYSKESASLYPLLLMECKAVKLNEKMKAQVCGYNAFVKAYFVAIANAEEVIVGWMDRQTREYQFIPGMPRYADLKSMVAAHYS